MIDCKFFTFCSCGLCAVMDSKVEVLLKKVVGIYEGLVRQEESSGGKIDSSTVTLKPFYFYERKCNSCNAMLTWI